MMFSRLTGALPLLTIAAGLVASTLLFDSIATAHGGSFRGPGGTLPPGAGPTGPRTPGSGGPPNTDQVGWQMWWTFNRDPYLDLKNAIYRTSAETGSDDYFLGHGQKDSKPIDLRPPAALLRSDVVPRLVKILEEESNKDLLTSALMALGKIGAAGESPTGPPLASVIRPHLASDNQEVAESAAIALGVLADRSAATSLASVLADDRMGRTLVGREKVPYRTRAFAGYGLGLLGFRSEQEDVKRYAVHQLIQALRNDESPQKDVRVACLIALGLVRLEVSGRELDDQGPRPTTSREGEIDFLLQYFETKRSPQVLAYVPVSLARLAFDASEETKASVVQRLLTKIELRSNTDKQVQQSALSALGLLADADDNPGDVAIRAALRRVAADGERMSRRLAMIALAKASARTGSGRGEAQTATETRAYFMKLLSNGTSTIRPWAAIALGILENHRVREGEAPAKDVSIALLSAMRNAKSPDEEGACAMALGLSRSIQAEDALLGVVVDRADDVLRGYAAVSLGMIQARGTIDALRKVVRDATYRPSLLRDGAIGLGLMGDKGLVNELVVLLRESDSLGTQSAIASALGFIGDVRAVQPLLDMIEDDSLSDTARAFGCVALGVVCDKEPLPFNAKLATDVNYWLAPPSLLDPAGGTGVLDLL